MTALTHRQSMVVLARSLPVLRLGPPLAEAAAKRVVAPNSLPPSGRMRLISIGIVGALVLQSLAVLLRTGPWLYPFINYPMYAAAHHEGDRIAYEHTVHAIFADGTETAFKSADLDSSPYFFELWVKAMVALPGDTYALGGNSAARAAAHSSIRGWLQDKLGSNAKALGRFVDVYTRRIEAKSAKTVVSLRVEDAPFVLTRAGFVRADGTEVVKTLIISRP